MLRETAASRVPPGAGGRSSQHWLVMPEAFAPDECVRLIALFDELDQADGGLVAGRFDTKVRQSALVWVPEDPAHDWVHARMTRLVADANREMFRFALDGFEEQVQIAAYGPGHYYDWHIDRGRGAVAGRRKLTISVQLTDPSAYGGGELEINADGHPFQAPRERGTAIAFAAHTLHRVAPVTFGLRHSLVVWVHGPDFV